MDKKTIVSFMGSPRENGHCTALSREIARGAKDTGFRIKEYNLNDKGVRGCQSCFYCRNHKDCSVKDYLTPMYRDIAKAEAIIVSSPIYYGQISGQAKLWLDRTFPFASGTLAEGNFGARLPGKKVITVFSQNHGDPNVYTQAMAGLHNFFVKLYDWRVVASLTAYGELDQESPEFTKLLTHAYAEGKALSNASK